jgi:hypothetical protein
VFLLATLLLSGQVFAQAPTDNPPANGETKPAPADEPLKFEQNEKLSDKEKVDRSSSELQKMRETLKVVLGKLEEARNAKDVVRLNCVNEKLTQIKGFIRIAEQSDVSLQEAVAKQESGSADHEFTKIEIATQRVRQLRADAEACIGQLAYAGSQGGTTVDVTYPQDLPSSDQTAASPPSPPVVVAPPNASPVE